MNGARVTVFLQEVDRPEAERVGRLIADVLQAQQPPDPTFPMGVVVVREYEWPGKLPQWVKRETRGAWAVIVPSEGDPDG